MLKFPFARLFGIIGSPRVGKNEVARFLNKTRGFEIISFGDQIKKEFGISIEEFEKLKLSGKAGEIRKELWKFSEDKIKEDPLYFINKTSEKINYLKNKGSSIVISDIRRKEELNAIVENNCFILEPKLYWIRDSSKKHDVENGILIDSKLDTNYLSSLMNKVNTHKLVYCKLTNINNDKQLGLLNFYRKLEQFFMYEDIRDIINGVESFYEYDLGDYLNQYTVKES